MHQYDTFFMSILHIIFYCVESPLCRLRYTISFSGTIYIWYAVTLTDYYLFSNKIFSMQDRTLLTGPV